MEPTPDPPAPAPANRPRPPQAELLHRAMARLLRPLVRLAIQSGLTFPVLADLLRSLYVEIATKELLGDKRSQTDSRVSLLTGVHRKEIRRQRVENDAPEPPSLTLSSQVMARWLGNPVFTGPDGGPMPLSRLGEGASFEALVSAVTKDIRPRALLDTWLDQGVVSMGADGLVRLEGTAFIPHGDRESQLFYFARNLHDHLAAAAVNVVAGGGPVFLDRGVHYDGLSAGAAAEIEGIARKAAIRTLLEVNRQALVIADRDDAARSVSPAPESMRAGHRVNLGIFLFTEREQPVAPD